MAKKVIVHNGSPWYVYLICFGLMTTAFFMAFDLWNIYGAQNHVYGNVEISREERTVDFKYVFEALAFEPTGVSGVMEITPEVINQKTEYDGTRNNYELLINGYPCYINDYNAGLIDSSFSMSFYDTLGVMTATTLLHIKIEFYYNKTKLSLTATNGGGAISYLNNLIASDGLTIEVSYSQLVLL
jgi:hypothetical protein